jgi:hypothetical protein
MSASRVSASACPSCGAELPAGARFCPGCGTSLAVATESASPAPAPAPPSAAGPHRSGVVRSYALLVVGCGALGAAIGLFASGHWPYGLILFGVAIVLLTLFLEASLRRQDSEVARRSAVAWAGGRVRVASAWEIWRARSDAAAEGRRVQAELVRLDEERGPALQALGEAAHAGDAEAEQAARARLQELDERRAGLERSLRERHEETQRRIRDARTAVARPVTAGANEPDLPPPPPGDGAPLRPAPDPGVSDSG